MRGLPKIALPTSGFKFKMSSRGLTMTSILLLHSFSYKNKFYKNNEAQNR